jgi:aminoglycoside phosphotransferase (APT) family kinase protein
MLQKAGYPVPALLLQETDSEILGKPFEIIQKLDGQALWRALASSEFPQAERLLARFGSLLAQLHQLDWRSFIENPTVYEKNPGQLLDEIISQYRSLYGKYNLKGFLQIVDWLDTHKHEISVQPAVVHQDFHANNVLLSPEDQFFVIDWTQFAVADYRLDLAWTLLIMGDFGNPDWKKQIFRAYTAACKHPIEHLDYFQVIVSMKLLGSMGIAFTFRPEELGLRAETSSLTKEQRSIFMGLSERVRDITGLTISDLETALANAQKNSLSANS